MPKQPPTAADPPPAQTLPPPVPIDPATPQTDPETPNAILIYRPVEPLPSGVIISTDAFLLAAEAQLSAGQFTEEEISERMEGGRRREMNTFFLSGTEPMRRVLFQQQTLEVTIDPSPDATSEGPTTAILYCKVDSRDSHKPSPAASEAAARSAMMKSKMEDERVRTILLTYFPPESLQGRLGARDYASEISREVSRILGDSTVEKIHTRRAQTKEYSYKEHKFQSFLTVKEGVSFESIDWASIKRLALVLEGGPFTLYLNHSILEKNDLATCCFRPRSECDRSDGGGCATTRAWMQANGFFLRSFAAIEHEGRLAMKAAKKQKLNDQKRAALEKAKAKMSCGLFLRGRCSAFGDESPNQETCRFIAFHINPEKIECCSARGETCDFLEINGYKCPYNNHRDIVPPPPASDSE